MKLALITGATSGIGYEYSLFLAKKGWDLIITGRREDKLYNNAQFIKKSYGVEVEALVVDFNTEYSYRDFLNNTVKKRDIGFLINNVGFSNHNNFFESDFDKNHKMIEAHITRLSEITHYAVQSMKSNGSGYIVNVSSLAGFLPSLSDPFYSGSKSFINTYSESIALILKCHNIVVQSLCPGFTKTDFHKDMNLKESAFKNRGLKRWMEPADVVTYSYNSLKLGKVIVIPGLTNRLVYRIVKFLPKKIYYNMASKKRALNEK